MFMAFTFLARKYNSYMHLAINTASFPRAAASGHRAIPVKAFLPSLSSKAARFSSTNCTPVTTHPARALPLSGVDSLPEKHSEGASSLP